MWYIPPLNRDEPTISLGGFSTMIIGLRYYEIAVIAVVAGIPLIWLELVLPGFALILAAAGLVIFYRKPKNLPQQSYPGPHWGAPQNVGGGVLLIEDRCCAARRFV